MTEKQMKEAEIDFLINGNKIINHYWDNACLTYFKEKQGENNENLCTER